MPTPSRHEYRANNGRQPDRVIFLVLDLERAEINVFFGRRIRDALIDEGQNSENDENNASELHKISFGLLSRDDRPKLGCGKRLQFQCHVELSRRIVLAVSELRIFRLNRPEGRII